MKFRPYCADCAPRVIRPTPEAQALVDLLCDVLSVRAGEVLTPEVIVERARNAAQQLILTYRMVPTGGDE